MANAHSANSAQTNVTRHSGDVVVVAKDDRYFSTADSQLLDQLPK